MIKTTDYDYDLPYYFISDLGNFCDDIVEKTFYRTKDEFK